jgi:hypothetical protein
MREALQVVRFSLRDVWDEFVLLVVFNVLWSLTALLPLLALLVLNSVDPIWALVVGLLLLLPLPAVSGALCFVTNQISRGKAAGWGTFAIGLRRYWAKSLVVALINVGVLLLLVTNIQFYLLALEGAWTNFAVSIWLVLGIYWLLVQVFWFPMILELENEKVFLALRNALAMVLVTPGFAVTLGILLLVLGILCVALTVPVILFMTSLFLLIANHATRSRLAFAQKKPYRPGLDEG